MAEIAPPPPPRPVAGLSLPDQMIVLQQDYVDAMAWGAQLRLSRAALIDWIERTRAYYLQEFHDGRPD